MKTGVARFGAVTLAVLMALTPTPSAAIAPVLLMMVREIAQQVATSMIKDALLSGVSGMGCKGIALSKALTAFDLRGGAGGMAGMLGGMPKVPAGISMPTLPAGMGLPNLPAGAALGMGAAMPPEFAARMSAMMPNAGALPPGITMNADTMAMMARMQQAMAQPLPPAETLATIDELFELGFLPKTIQIEFKECMVLVPETIAALGIGMGMLKPMIPQLRQAREELYALSPADQDEVTAMLVQQMKALPANERAALMEHLGSGFFPPRVSEGVKAGLAAR
jgi:hypothetical protein